MKHNKIRWRWCDRRASERAAYTFHLTQLRRGVWRKLSEEKKATQQRDNLEGENGEQNNCLNEILDVYTWKHGRASPKNQFSRWLFFPCLCRSSAHKFFCVFWLRTAAMMPYAKKNVARNLHLVRESHAFGFFFYSFMACLAILFWFRNLKFILATWRSSWFRIALHFSRVQRRRLVIGQAVGSLSSSCLQIKTSFIHTVCWLQTLACVTSGAMRAQTSVIFYSLSFYQTSETCNIVELTREAR